MSSSDSAALVFGFELSIIFVFADDDDAAYFGAVDGFGIEFAFALDGAAAYFGAADGFAFALGGDYDSSARFAKAACSPNVSSIFCNYFFPPVLSLLPVLLRFLALSFDGGCGGGG